MTAKQPTAQPAVPKYLYAPLSVRGIINERSCCYASACIQALLHCPAVAGMLYTMFAGSDFSDEKATKYPICNVFANLVSLHRLDPQRVALGQAFSPRFLLETLRTHPNWHPVPGAQQDAQDCLGFLLEHFHEESKIEAEAPVPTPKGQAKEDDGWVQVDRNIPNRSKVQEHKITASPITAIFGGEYSSEVSGDGKTSVMREPFTSVPLHIGSDSIYNIRDAILELTKSERVEQDDKMKKYSMKLLKDPTVLVLQIKRWQQKDSGITKLKKKVEFDEDLVIPAPAYAKGAKKHAKYKLMSVIVHRGETWSSGHYVAYVAKYGLNPGTMQVEKEHPCVTWFEFDDDQVSSVSWDLVKAQQAYILLYQCCDGQLPKLQYSKDIPRPSNVCNIFALPAKSEGPSEGKGKKVPVTPPCDTERQVVDLPPGASAELLKQKEKKLKALAEPTLKAPEPGPKPTPKPSPKPTPKAKDPAAEQLRKKKQEKKQRQKEKKLAEN